MNTGLQTWIWTPLFCEGVAAAHRKSGPGIYIVDYNPQEPRQMLLAFRQLRAERGLVPVTVFDVARFPDDRPWAYVADGLNKSGVNPLRGLGALLREPFVDLSRLYLVPQGQSGVEAVALGARYPGTDLDSPAHSRRLPVCSYLHDAAILAHVEGLLVTGVLVAETHLRSFDFQQVR